MSKIRLLLFVTAVFVQIFFCDFHTKAQFYNGLHQEFGKNRVQYREFLWSYYKFRKCDVYFYTGGKELAGYTAKEAGKIISETEDFLDIELDDKIQFIVFNRLTDLRQSNIGYVSDETNNVGGITRIIGSKVFLYYDGSHVNLEEQIRAGVAEILINQMMYGGNWRERVKNSTLLTLPDWYINGLISFLSKKWNAEIEDRIRDGILSGRYKKFNHLTGKDAVYAGHSIWQFIAWRYGEALIPSIVYMTKISRNIESGFLFVLGASIKSLTAEWLAYYYNQFYENDKMRYFPEAAPIIKRPRQSMVFSQIKISPNAKKAAFVTNESGKYIVWIYDIETGRRKKILKEGHRLDRIHDYSYPLLAWHPEGNIISIIEEKKDRIWLKYYHLNNKKFIKRELFEHQKILDFSYSDNGKFMAMSAVRNGQNDIFVFDVSRNTYEQITFDAYDDRQPRFLKNSEHIIFSSARPNDTISKAVSGVPASKDFDLFLYDYPGHSPVLKRLTNTRNANETGAAGYDDNYFSYLSDKSGINNRYVAMFDSVISHVDTIAHYRYITTTLPMSNYSRNILEQDININAGKFSEILYSSGRYRMYLNDIFLPQSKTAEPIKTNSKIQQKEDEALGLDNYQLPVAIEEQADTIQEENKEPAIAAVNKIDINNYMFDIEIEKKQEKIKEALPKTLIAQDSSGSFYEQDLDYLLSKQWNYNPVFSTDFFVSRLDNNYLSSSYQKFTGGEAIYTNPGFNLLFKLGISDLLEDYRITGGFRLSGNLSNNEYFISYEGLKQRPDKQIVFHRQGLLTVQSNNSTIKVYTHDAKFVLRWPFNEVMSITGTAILRNDQTVYLATDALNLMRASEYETWGGLKSEFIFDNTRSRGLNLYFGTRYKLFAEWFRQVDKQETNLFVVGIDYRKYTKIHRDFILANRLAASNSFGDQKLVYYMGGTDGWLKPDFDRSVPIDQKQNYAYQTLATNMRGFIQNIRNGTSFVVLNNELRMPVFRYFNNRPIKSDFISNFQMMSFFDIGTAWTGKTPYSEDNTFNTKVIDKTTFIITLTEQKEPVVAGFGFGIRSRLWGYFVRLDWARGIEDGKMLKHIWYLSLSLDF